MALYRINRRNTLFVGIPGDFVRAEPDPLLDAAVKSGIVTRVDVEELVKISEPKKKSRKPAQEKAVVVRMSDVETGGSDGGTDQAGGDQVDT